MHFAKVRKKCGSDEIFFRAGLKMELERIKMLQKVVQIHDILKKSRIFANWFSDKKLS